VYPLRAAWRRSAVGARAPALVALPAFPPFALAALLICATAWQPFDVTLDVGNLAQKWHTLRPDPWQVASVGSHFIGALRYALFSLAAALWLKEAGVRRSSFWATILGVIAAGGLQASETIIESRMPGAAELAADFVGTGAGAWLAIGWPHRRPSRFWAALFALASAAGAASDRLAATTGSMVRLGQGFDLALMVLSVGVVFALALRADARV
jgi:hypothetical protein